MKILILGARGMLGQSLVQVFADHEVLAWDHAECDITDLRQVRDRVAAACPDVLVNGAAYNAVDRAEGEPDIANHVNGSAVGHLATVAAAVGTVFVHFSSDYVFDGVTRGGYSEDAPPYPLNAYGRSKLLGEQAIQRVAAAHPGWRWYCIRTSRLFGPAGMSPSAKRSFVDTMLAKAATTDRLEVVDAEESSPTFTLDLAHATQELIGTGVRVDADGAPPGVYHRTNAGSCTWYAFAQRILRRVAWNGILVPVASGALERWARRPAHSILRNTKCPPLRRWEEALDEHLADWAVHPLGTVRRS